MKIERIYIACYKRGLHLTRCCVASIRHWYPQLPISLIKDEIDGPYDTSDMQQYWDVDVLRTRKHRFGRGMSKFEALTLPGRERCLILDNDIVFLGRVIDRLECFDEDFIVASHGGPPEEFEAHYFDQRLLKQIDRQFKYRGGAFNTGQFVATTGILEPADLAEHLTAKEPRTAARPDIFQACEQGLVNYLLLNDGRRAASLYATTGSCGGQNGLSPAVLPSKTCNATTTCRCCFIGQDQSRPPSAPCGTPRSSASSTTCISRAFLRRCASASSNPPTLPPAVSNGCAPRR